MKIFINSHSNRFCRGIHTTLVNNVKDYYSILGISRGSSPDKIKTAYYARAKLHHPDANKGDRVSAVKFQEISEAYEILSDPMKRRAYDRTTSPRPFYEEPRPTTPNPEPTSTTIKSKPAEPISMNHIQHVFKTLNHKPDPDDPGEPRFRPLEDHNYENSDFNRYLYSRRWDPEARVWVYKHRPKHMKEAYDRKLDYNSFKVRLVIAVCVISSLAVAFFK